MRLVEALEIIQRTPRAGEPVRVALLCGFTPLHLKTFLAAYLARAFPERPVEIVEGLYGDLVGSIERLETDGLDAGVVAIEWADVDPRLGWRHLGGWGERERADILRGLEARLGRLGHAVGRLALPVAIAAPTLPMAPVAPTALAQESPFELEIRQRLGAVVGSLARARRTRVVSTERLMRLSPPSGRHDLRGELASGFPYTLAHADRLAELLACIAFPRAAKKGLITDLDDTLWAGILGELEPAEISWDLDRRSLLHGAYQQLLRSLAESGTLVAVASKNDPALVDQALAREDLLVRRDHLFPIEVSWERKSAAVSRVLEAWNVDADGVVFVDDSALELAEVEAAHPGITCLRFPTGDERAIARLLEELRDLFGAETVTSEDRIRAASLRAAPPRMTGVESGERILEGAEAELAVSFERGDDPRAFELVSKTNQFNVNGRRYTEAEWLAALARPDAFVLTVGYQDKYGPLGKIAVVAGRAGDAGVVVETWVMSCRAFSRRIEHHCLALLFERFDAAAIALDFAATPRNEPIRKFLEEVGGRAAPGLRIPRATFEERCPPLYHRVREVTRG